MPVSRRRVLVLGGLLAAAPARVISQPARSTGRAVRLGVLHLAPPATSPSASDLFQVFSASLKDRGWAVGRNLVIESRTTADAPHRAVDFAKELLQNGAEMLVVVGSSNALAARRATSTVPIVMLASGYPVESGLAASLARPGGNVTGLRIYAGEVFGKYVALAKELVPSLKELGIFWGYGPPAFPAIETPLGLDEMQRAADSLSIHLRVWQNPDAAALAANLRDAANVRMQALFVTSGTVQAVPAAVAQITHFCEARRLPAMCDIAGIFFQTGGVLAYSVDLAELGARGASFVDRILRGANPAELPIEQPTRFQLIVNARRAKALGFEIPGALLTRADRVIG